MSATLAKRADAGVVDEDVDAAESRDGFVDDAALRQPGRARPRGRRAACHQPARDCGRAAADQRSLAAR